VPKLAAAPSLQPNILTTCVICICHLVPAAGKVVIAGDTYPGPASGTNTGYGVQSRARGPDRPMNAEAVFTRSGNDKLWYRPTAECEHMYTHSLSALLKILCCVLSHTVVTHDDLTKQVFLGCQIIIVFLRSILSNLEKCMFFSRSGGVSGRKGLARPAVRLAMNVYASSNIYRAFVRQQRKAAVRYKQNPSLNPTLSNRKKCTKTAVKSAEI
jgi:hypothetical protein